MFAVLKPETIETTRLQGEFPLYTPFGRPPNVALNVCAFPPISKCRGMLLDGGGHVKESEDRIIPSAYLKGSHATFTWYWKVECAYSVLR